MGTKLQSMPDRDAALRRSLNWEYRLFWPAAFLVALLWHMVWLAWLPAPHARSRPVALPVSSGLSYASQDNKMRAGKPTAGDLQRLADPSLFALPSVAGFSRLFLTGEIGARPPLVLPMPAPSSMDRAAVTAEPRFSTEALRAVKAAVLAESTNLTLWLPDVPAFQAWPAEGKPVNVECSGGLKEAVFLNLDQKKRLWLRDERTWEARIYVEFNPQGIASHVVLDVPTEVRSLNNQIVRYIHSLRIKPSGAPISGYVIVQYPGCAPFQNRMGL